MREITLRHLTNEDKDQFFKAYNSDWGEFEFAHYWESLANKSFEIYICIVPDFSKGRHIPKDHVPCTFLFAFNDKNEIVGRTSIRHELNDHLLMVGGHVGYGVVPEYRRQGYATLILKESLKYIKNNLPYLTKILVTCDQGNIGSQKTIEKNNGVLENTIEINEHKSKMRYCINV
jgi:predicted acetyltransferase